MTLSAGRCVLSGASLGKFAATKSGFDYPFLKVLSSCSRSFHKSSVLGMSSHIKVGDKLPNVELFESTPKNKVNILDLFSGKKGVLFAVPGAFTPGCSKTHLPGYVDNYDALRKKGAELVVCVAVNDPFVMEAWGKDQKATGKVKLLADPAAEFTKAIGMDIDLTNLLGGVRSKRYSMVVENGMVKYLNVEPDGLGLTCSLVDNVMNNI